MEKTGHGGGCCGIVHSWGFSLRYADVSNSEARVKKVGLQTLSELDNILYDKDGWYGGGVLNEVVLTSPQKVVYHNSLINRGFKLVNSFYNNNSGNNIHIYHKAPPTEIRGEINSDAYKSLEELSDNPVVVGKWFSPTREEPSEVVSVNWGTAEALSHG